MSYIENQFLNEYTRNNPLLKEFIMSTLVTLFWAEIDQLQEEEGIEESPDLSNQAFSQLIIDCSYFYTLASAHLIEGEQSVESWGHDFILTRNGHGAGYWDGDYPIHGDALTEICEQFKELQPYIGDDGAVYFY